ncbi:MAG: hypothetical protein ABH832_01570 [bacterium]
MIQQYRCKFCGQLFFKAEQIVCELEIKCGNCGKAVHFGNVEKCRMFSRLSDFLKDKQTSVNKDDLIKELRACIECGKINECLCYKMAEDMLIDYYKEN